MTRLHRILDLARWAPSGDNSQPWRFEIRSPDHVVVHALLGGLGVYDLEGTAALTSVGALIETMRIATSAEGCTLTFDVGGPASNGSLPIDVRVVAAPGVAADPLQAFVRSRSVQRKSLETTALGADAKARLEQSVGDGFRVVWFESTGARFRMAWLAVRSARIRLTIPEAYAVHRQVIEWDARFSEDRIPDQALGTDALSLRFMRWVLASWPRVRLMNRFFGGTWLPRLQLELVPGLRCAAHFAIVATAPPGRPEEHLRAGAAAQRFWLTAASLGLQLQPQHTPLVFAAYARGGVRFSEVAEAARRADEIDGMLERLLAPEPRANAVFLGRLGYGGAAIARSLRLPLENLLVPSPHEEVADPRQPVEERESAT
jgi:nitroreductase